MSATTGRYHRVMSRGPSIAPMPHGSRVTEASTLLDRPVIADIAILPKGELALVDLNPLGDTAQTARDLRYSLVRQTHA